MLHVMSSCWSFSLFVKKKKKKKVCQTLVVLKDELWLTMSLLTTVADGHENQWKQPLCLADATKFVCLVWIVEWWIIWTFLLLLHYEVNNLVKIKRFLCCQSYRGYFQPTRWFDRTIFETQGIKYSFQTFLAFLLIRLLKVTVGLNIILVLMSVCGTSL